MAESIITSLLGKVGTLMLQEAIFLGGLETQILSLHDELEWINFFLRDADEKRKKDRRVNIWVSQIRNLAYFAEDILDLYTLDVMRKQRKNIGQRIVSYHKHLVERHKLGNQLEDINRRLEKISANKSKYGIEASESGETSSAGMDNGSIQKVNRNIMEDEVDDIVGLEKDTGELTTLLTKEDPRQLLVVSIVGMGGLGKTTLAKKVCNRNEVKDFFNSCAWIYVSQEYRIKDLLFSAISQLTMLKKQELEKKNEEDLKNILSDQLKQKRCLLVFDDVWKTQDWDKLKRAFLYDPNQNDQRKQQRVLLTTRNLEVAKRAEPLNAIDPHELKPLDEKESLELFEKKVLQFQVPRDQQRLPSELKEFETELVAKCHGLPLAIVALGGVLSTKPQTTSVWKRTLDSVKWHLNQGQEQCMSILALSYMDLPYYLKSCFLYFSVSPEDHEIESKKLIWLWVAEGFIQQRGNESMEDVAEEYLVELIDRSMIQVAKRRLDGSVETCRIHDLLRDMAVSEAKEEKLVEIYGSSTSNCSASTCLNRFRWLGIHSDNNNGMYHHVPSSSSILYHLHSLLDFSGGGSQLDKKMWKGFNLLRVLDLEGAENIRTLPEEIGGLVLLKYLSLKTTEIKRIPHSMGNLCNLQTLDLSWTNLSDIPKEIWRMQQLRHLICHVLQGSPGSVVKCMENVVNKIGNQSGPSTSRINNLRELQTLCLDKGSWIGALDKLTNLRQLEISYKGRETTLDRKEALIASLTELEKLRVLSLSECFPPNLFDLVSFSHHVHLRCIKLCGELEKIPVSDEFPPNLIELILLESHLKEEDQPMATLEKLPNLKILQLVVNAVEGKEMICSAGGFAKLQELRIHYLPNLEEVQVQQGAFPALKF